MEKNRKVIYVISQFQTPKVNKKYASSVCGDAGWFTSKRAAIKAVKSNSCDLSEFGYYDLVAILALPEGLYPTPDTDEDELWFKWNFDLEKYEECERPSEFDNLTFTIDFIKTFSRKK